MTYPTFPVLPGLSFPVKRSPTFQSTVHKAVSGVSTRLSTQPFAIYSYELPFEFLRAADAYAEIQALMSFYVNRQGQALPFHFNDPDDFSIVGQTIGVGDGATKNFGFVRTMGTAVDLVEDAIEAGAVIYVNAVPLIAGTDYTFLHTDQYQTTYGVSFTNAPANGAIITADFQFNWLCCFDQDSQEFSKFQYLNGKGLWESKSVKFSTVLQ